MNTANRSKCRGARSRFSGIFASPPRRSIVAPTPGTTRDVVTATLAIDGWPVEVCDTAGLREAGESLESEGIELARDAAAAADLCLWLLDASCEPVWPPGELKNVQLVVNKIDRPATWDLERAAEAVCVSATTGQGLDELCAAVSRWLVPEVPALGTAVPLLRVEELCEYLHRLLQTADRITKPRKVKDKEKDGK